MNEISLFPTCQVRIVRFYVSSSTPSAPLLSSSPSSSSSSSSRLLSPSPRPGPSSPCSCQLRATPASFTCRIRTASICFSVFAAGPLPLWSAPSVRYRTPTTISRAQCSPQDLNRDHLRSVLAAGPEPRASAPSVRCRTSTNRHHLKEDMSERMSERMSEDIYQKERQKDC